MLFFKPPKPVPPAMVTPPKDTEFYLHFGENSANFDKLRTRIAFLHEMMKLFPAYEQNGYSGVGEDYNPSGWTSHEGPMEEEGIGRWYEDIIGHRGYVHRYRIDGHFEERYGDWHRNAQEVGGSMRYWGYNEGQIAQNLNFNPSAWEAFEGLENSLVNTDEYADLLFEVNSDDDGDNDKSLSHIRPEEWAEVRSYLQEEFGDKSFYEIVMGGADTVTFTPRDDNPDTDFNESLWYGSYTPGSVGYLYRDGGSEDAYHMMLALLESRRKIFYAMSYVFGSPWFIKNNDHTAHINHFDHAMDVEFAGVDDHNKALLLLYYSAQHSLHYVLPAYSGGADFNGGVYSARDCAGFEQFRDWIRSGVENYIGGLSGGEKDRVQSLYNEFKFDIAQPYGKNGEKAGEQDYIGWDYYSAKYDLDGTLYNEENGYPDWVNPIALKSGHWNYSVAQLMGLSEYQIMGKTPLEYEGSYYNLYQTNPVVHMVGRLTREKEIDMTRAWETMGINQFNRIMYKQAKRRYKGAVQREKEAKYNDAIENKKFQERRAEAKNDANTAAKRRKKRNSDMSFDEAMENAHNRMLSKSINKTIQRMKEIRKSSEAKSKERRMAQKRG